MVVYAHCNTFTRDILNSNPSYGIRFTGQVEFDDYAVRLAGLPYYTPMKNLFIAPSPRAKMWYLYGANGAGAEYHTFSGFAASADQTTRVNFLSDFIGGTTTQGILPGPPNGRSDQYFNSDLCATDPYSDGSGPIDNGAGVYLPRPGGGVPPLITPTPSQPTGRWHVGQNSPNPVVEGTTQISYRLPANEAAELTLRDVLTGQVVKRVTFAGGEGELTLAVAGLRPGVYAYAVTCGGAVVATRRLVVQP